MPEPESIAEAEQMIYQQLVSLGVELERAQADLEKYRKVATDYIRADYLGTHAFTKTALCVLLGHPDIYPEGQEPAFVEPHRRGCPCGMRREKGKP